MSGKEDCKLIFFLIVHIVHSRKNISLDYIKRSIIYNMRKATTANQRTSNFSRIVESVFLVMTIFKMQLGKELYSPGGLLGPVLSYYKKF